MRFLHISDLHIGKYVNGFSMLKDQEHILNQIVQIAKNTKADAVLIAGDIYDKSVPSAEAVMLLDNFLCDLSACAHVFVISGNHDSPERLNFGSRIMDKCNLHIVSVYNGLVPYVTLSDEFGPIRIRMLPFVRPYQVRQFHPDAEIDSYESAIKTALMNVCIDPFQRNILITHQFIAGVKTCDSEESVIGSAESISSNLFDDFDYVALGHIHNAQSIGRNAVRYCGTPLKYSFSEVNSNKTVTLVDIHEKGSLQISELPLVPLHDMVRIRGSYDQVTRRDFYQPNNLQNAYVGITLTDEYDIPDAAAKLRVIYPYLMRLDYDNKRTQSESSPLEDDILEQKSPSELLADFYKKQNGKDLSPAQKLLADNLIHSIWL